MQQERKMHAYMGGLAAKLTPATPGPPHAPANRAQQRHRHSLQRTRPCRAAAGRLAEHSGNIAQASAPWPPHLRRPADVVERKALARLQQHRVQQDEPLDVQRGLLHQELRGAAARWLRRAVSAGLRLRAHAWRRPPVPAAPLVA